MNGRGRPLRFLALVTLAWIGARAAMLWPHAHSLPEAIRALVPFAAAAVPEAARPEAAPARHPAASARADPPRRAVAAQRHRGDPRLLQLALLDLIEAGDPEGGMFAAARMAPGSTSASPSARAPARAGPVASRWSASAWLVVRPGNGLGAAPGAGQLGGSQAGARIAWQPDPARRLSLYGRFTAPLRGAGREAAFGVEWQPAGLPARVSAERRIGVDGQPGGTALGVVAGLDRAGLPAGFRLEAYGQAGAIARARLDPYADGAARATREVAARGPLRVSLGLGAWGAAQRGAARLDVGPSATLGVALGREQVRLAIDWRERIAGDARPGSGLALTLGGDF